MNTTILFLTTALVNAIWQPALIAAIAWLALKISRCNNATTRHAVWTLALFASVVVPLLSAMPIVWPQSAAVATTAQPVTAMHRDETRATKAVTAPVQFPATQPALALRRPSLQVHPTVAMVVSIAWLMVALGILARLLVSFFYLERLKHDALPFPIESRHALTRYDRAEKGDRDVRVCVSGEITVPVAVGIFDAMILLPSDLVSELDANDLDRILLHELAHVRRSDDWVNLFERIVQALLFFSPGIYWISRQMDLEREVACDDWVLEQSAENVPYARCLARIVEMTQWPYTAPAAPGVFVTRKSMSIRIERLLARGRDIRIRLAVVPSLLSLTLIAGIVVAGGFVSPTIAYTIDHGVVATHGSHMMTRSAAHKSVVAMQQHDVSVATAPPAPAVLATAPAVHVAVSVKVKPRTLDAKSVSTATSISSAYAWASSDDATADPDMRSKMLADAGYLDELAAAGYKNLTVDEVIELKSLGVDRAYIQDLHRSGYKDLTPRDLVQLKSLDVDGAYIAAIRGAGLPWCDTRELIQLKSLGVDGDYVRGLAAAGYPHLQPRDYVRLKSLGVDSTYVSELGAAGLTGLTARELTELKSLGVDGAYVKDLASAGYSHLSTRQYVQMKSLGVDGDYVRKLASHGFNHLTVDQLIKYKSLGISDDK